MLLALSAISLRVSKLSVELKNEKYLEMKWVNYDYNLR